MIAGREGLASIRINEKGCSVSEQCRFASDEVARLLASNGIHDLASAFEAGDSIDGLHERRATRHAHKLVVKLELKSATGPTTVYIKRQWSRGRLIPRLTDLRHRIGLQCSPVHEWRGLRIMQAAGFHVSEPLAVFWRGLGFSSGAVVTRAVPPSHSIDDMLISGAFERMAPAGRDSLIAAASKVVARLHRDRISWRSMKAKHFYPEDLGGNRWRIWLIDCEGVYRWASRRDCEKAWQVYLQTLPSPGPNLQSDFVSAYRLASSC